ncbi:MAG: mechanosensitive ion channel [Salinisphaera sp.]|nr:mechanosensitive ion channel [Salinisphaera sp.]
MEFLPDILRDPQALLALLAPFGVKLIGAIAILVIGRWVAKLLIALLRRTMIHHDFDDTLVDFLGTVGYITLMAFVVIAALGQLGVQTTAAAAILGGAAIAVGLSLKDQLSALAAGVMLILFRPFSKGHFVKAAGIYGTVESVHIANTLLISPDNQEITIPNNDVWGSAIVNYSARDTRRMDLTIGISLTADVGRAKAVLGEILAADERVLADPPAEIRVHAITDSAVNILFRPWFERAVFWDAYWETMEQIKKRFDAEGIDFAHQRRFIEIAPGDADPV